MRQIKFRAWDKENKRMLPVYLTDMDSGLMPISGDWDYVIRPFEDECELMQFTGLIDRNGRDVYEGDVYQFPPARNDTPPFIDLVEDLQTFFEAKGLREGEYTWDYSEIEVIGNVWENPELLTKEEL